MPKAWRLRAYLSLALLVVILDQASKALVLAYFHEHQVMPLLPMFNLVLVFNEGAAFSFLSDAGGWQRGFFIGVGGVAVWVLLIWLARLRQDEFWTGIALALVLGGAIGNLIDRIRLGKVVDFLDFYWQQWHWPAFNLADTAITCGVVVLLWTGLQASR